MRRRRLNRIRRLPLPVNPGPHSHCRKEATGEERHARAWAKTRADGAGVAMRVDGAAGAAGKGRRGRGFLSRQDGDAGRRLWAGRRLRRLCAARSAAISAATSPAIPPSWCRTCRAPASLRAVNWLNNLAPRDGTAIAHFARNMPLMGMLGSNSNAQFDPRKFNWLGSSSSFANDAYILIVRTDIPVKTIDDARRPGGEPLVLGGTAEGATGNDVPIILRDTIGLNVKQVVGYPDSRRAVPRHGARRGAWPHHRPFLGQGDQAGMAQAGQRLPCAGAVRARDAPPGFPERADGARACAQRKRARC